MGIITNLLLSMHSKNLIENLLFYGDPYRLEFIIARELHLFKVLGVHNL